MKTIQKMRIFAAGVGGALIASWITSEVQAQQPIKAVDSKIRVCVAKDGVMRLAGPASCPAGQKPVDLKVPDASSPDSPDEKKNNGEPDGKACAAAQKKIDELANRLSAVEKSPEGSLRNRVTAPFQVFGRDGKVIFRVDEDRTAAIYDGAGVRVAQMGASKNGGYVSAKSASNKLDIGMEAGSDFAQVVITDSGTERLILGRDPQHGTYRLKVFGKGGSMVAGIGQDSSAGKGAGMVIVNSENNNGGEAFMLGDRNGKGIVGIGRAGKSLAFLTEGSKGGLLNIMDANSQIMVEAGVVAGGFGVVRVGPQAFKPGYGVLGLPGSYLAGKP